MSVVGFVVTQAVDTISEEKRLQLETTESHLKDLSSLRTASLVPGGGGAATTICKEEKVIKAELTEHNSADETRSLSGVLQLLRRFNLPPLELSGDH